MKVFFDSNVYVAEALLGHAAIAVIAATERAGWRIFCSTYVLYEVQRVLTDYKRLPQPFAARTRALNDAQEWSRTSQATIEFPRTPPTVPSSPRPWQREPTILSATIVISSR